MEKTIYLVNGAKSKILRMQGSYFHQDIKNYEYVVAIGKILGIQAMIAYLFYESWVAFFLLLPAGLWRFRKWEEDCIQRKAREFQDQFREALQSISTSLRVGYSMENAMIEAKKDLNVLYSEETSIQREFTYMMRQIYLQLPMNQILEEWAKRVGQEEVTNFVNVFILSRKSGGNMIGIMKNAIYQIREKMDVRREIETILAARKYEFKVMTVIPFGMIAYMKFSFPEFMKILYGNLLGVGVMSLCLMMFLGAFMLGEKIVNIEV